MSKQPEKPKVHLAGQKKGPPTLDQLVALTKQLTGRDSTPEEIERVRAKLDARAKSS